MGQVRRPRLDYVSPRPSRPAELSPPTGGASHEKPGTGQRFNVVLLTVMGIPSDKSLQTLRPNWWWARSWNPAPGTRTASCMHSSSSMGTETPNQVSNLGLGVTSSLRIIALRCTFLRILLHFPPGFREKYRRIPRSVWLLTVSEGKIFIMSAIPSVTSFRGRRTETVEIARLFASQIDLISQR